MAKKTTKSAEAEPPEVEENVESQPNQPESADAHAVEQAAPAITSPAGSKTNPAGSKKVPAGTKSVKKSSVIIEPIEEPAFARKPAPAAKPPAAAAIDAKPKKRSKAPKAAKPDSGVAEAAAFAAETFEDAVEGHSDEGAREAAVKSAAATASEPAFQPEEKDQEARNQEDHDQEDREPQAPPKLERLQKILAASGVASRRHAEEMITEGRVQVNGQVVNTLGSKADAARDHIRVDGKLLHGSERLRYFVLNKPRGFVTTVSDPEGRPTVMDFFAKMAERLYPVGRLDYLSEGLLLVTNDGELANKLTRAASGVEKTYLVKVSGQPDPGLVEKLRDGLSIDRGKPGEGRVHTAPARVQQVREGENPWFEVTLIEGRNRELRKMFEEIGHHVEKIRRVGYGPLVLDVEPGNMRELDPQELHLLRLAAEGKWKPKRIKAAEMLPREAGRSANLKTGRDRPRPSFPPREPGRGGPGGPGSFQRPGSSPKPFAGTRPGPSQDRGAEFQTPTQPSGPAREQDRRPARPSAPGRGFQPRDQRRDSRPGFGQDRGGPPRGNQGGRTSFAKPQGDRPYRGKPAYGAAPPRTGRPADSRPPRDNAGFAGARKPFRPRTDAPSTGREAAGGREGTSGTNRPFDKRPAPAGADFARNRRPGFPQGQGNGRGLGRTFDRPGRSFERPSQGSGTRPPRPEARPEGRPAPSVGDRPASSPRFGTGATSRPRPSGPGRTEQGRTTPGRTGPDRTGGGSYGDRSRTGARAGGAPSRSGYKGKPGGSNSKPRFKGKPSGKSKSRSGSPGKRRP
jgi:23S rRNA pseudouridine2605 synthase